MLFYLYVGLFICCFIYMLVYLYVVLFICWFIYMLLSLYVGLFICCLYLYVVLGKMSVRSVCIAVLIHLSHCSD